MERMTQVNVNVYMLEDVYVDVNIHGVNIDVLERIAKNTGKKIIKTQHGGGEVFYWVEISNDVTIFSDRKKVEA